LISTAAVAQASKPNCGCTQGASIKPSPMYGALSAFLVALTNADRDELAKYSARFALAPNHRRNYRTAADQTRLVEDLTKLRITAFYVCVPMTSTAELAYREHLRRY